MVDKPKTGRELAARALCRHDGLAEDETVDGHARWEAYLPAADAVLTAIDYQEIEWIPVYRLGDKLPGT